MNISKEEALIVKKFFDNHAIDIGYLYDWYQSSIDETIPPVWTDEHIEELNNDFYLIPKEIVDTLLY